MKTTPETNSTLPDDKSPVLRPALVLFLVLSLVTGLLYPLLVTGVAQAVFPHQA
ncbi:MAG: potassium-transporting ATPase subunit C, partial [Hydrogenophaga sp.]|nr:potassium-transporting ATPase subunit C [Hydrogenophaga sp.]